MSTLTENNVGIKLEKVTFDTDQGILQNEELRWGLSLKDVYRLGLNFYKDMVGKVLHLSYEDKLRLVAYTQQAMHGSLNEETAQPLGVLDVIGKDRRQAWAQLGDISQVQAMAGYIHMLDRVCPLFKPYVEAYQVDSEEKLHQKKAEEEEQKARQELQNRSEQEQKRVQWKESNEEEQVRRIKEALNAQTYEQFLQYAQQQYPGNFDQQAVLIRQLQDQHYHQYMQQVAVDQRLSDKIITDPLVNSVEEKVDTDRIKTENESLKVETSDNSCMANILNDYSSEKGVMRSEHELSGANIGSQAEDSDEGDGFPKIESPNMWTRPDITKFKATVRKSADGRGILQVGHGEAVTIRVPTHDGGKCLFWEFASDHYDIGFGLLFEWSKPINPQVTIHVSESDEEEDEYDENGESNDELDVEGASNSSLKMLRPPMSVVIPVYRRDCHQEVYAGSHSYPGEGVYLLKFDNSYSLWRSKTLYYRVYYTR